MKIGWLLNDNNGNIKFFDSKPRYWIGDLVQIVYTEIVE